jgi:hypothetical protein
MREFDVLKAAHLMKSLRNHWELVLYLAAVHVAAERGTDVLSEVQSITRQVAAHDLNGVWDDRPLLNVRARQGNDLKALLDIEGKRIGNATSKVLEWQVMHRGASAEDVRAYILTHREEFS